MATVGIEVGRNHFLDDGIVGGMPETRMASSTSRRTPSPSRGTTCPAVSSCPPRAVRTRLSAAAMSWLESTRVPVEVKHHACVYVHEEACRWRGVFRAG